MQLRRLEVTNIRSFEHGRLDLGPGTTLLVGDVGAGKSSLLFAIEMALFGAAEVDAAFLVRHGTSHAEVAVTLEDAERTFAVRRRFRRVRRRGRETYEPERITFVDGGRATAYSSTEIRQRVIELLGFPDNPNPRAHSDLWRWAIYVPQERMREILSADPEERLATMRKALGVERYQLAAENAQALERDLRASVRQRREEALRMAHYDLEFAEAVGESDRLRVQRTGLAEAVRGAEADLARAKELRTSAETTLAELDADQRELDSLRKEDAADDELDRESERVREVRSVELTKARQERAGLEPAFAERARLRSHREEAERRVRAGREELDRKGEELRSLARALANASAAERRAEEVAARTRRARAERDSAFLELSRALEEGPAHEPPELTPRTLAEIDRLIATTRASEHAALEVLARARAALGQIEELLRAGVCPTCEQPVRIEQFAAHREEASSRLASAEAERQRLGDEIREVEDERKARERYERAHERWLDVERRRASLRETGARREEEVRSAEAAELEGRDQLRAAREEVESLRPVEAEERRLRTRLAEAEEAWAALAKAEGRANEAEQRIAVLEASIVRGTAELEHLAAEVAARARRRGERGRRIADLGRLVASAAEARAALARSREAERAAEERLRSSREALVRTDAQLDALVERQTAAERGRAERANLLAEAIDLEAKAAWVGDPFRFHVLRMEKELLAHAQVMFDRAFARFFASLIDDTSLVARTDASFTPEVTIEGEPTPAEALSGGERTSLALAFRLALASVVRSLGAVRLETLLLDEPTDGFSSEQVVRMGELLEELGLPQVLVVSHESQLTGIADRTVKVVKVEGRSTLEADARSGPTPVTETGEDEPSPPPAPAPPEPLSRPAS